MNQNEHMNDQLEVHHVTSFISAFIMKERRNTYSGLLANAKRRRKVLERLNHKILKDIDLKLTHSSPPENIKWENLAFIFSDCSTIDRITLPAHRAIELMEASCFGTVVSVIAGKLAAIKPESPSKTIWLY